MILNQKTSTFHSFYPLAFVFGWKVVLLTSNGFRKKILLPPRNPPSWARAPPPSSLTVSRPLQVLKLLALSASPMGSGRYLLQLKLWQCASGVAESDCSLSAAPLAHCLRSLALSSATGALQQLEIETAPSERMLALKGVFSCFALYMAS